MVISLIISVLALIVLLWIVMRKFPVLALLDPNNIPGEREAKFKEEIIKARVERDLTRLQGLIGRFWLSFSKFFSGFLKNKQAQLKKLKNNYQAVTRLSWSEKQKKIKNLLDVAIEFQKNEELSLAEEKMLEAISLDQKNIEAFFLLGELYQQQKKWPEARQTLSYVIKLVKHSKSDGLDGEVALQEVYFSLAEIEVATSDHEAALENIHEALEIEPNNPRYLDLILDLSIIKKDKIAALDIWEKIAVVNPDNQKLIERRHKIEKL